MKDKLFYLRFRIRVFRRKILKFIEFIKLYRDWVKGFDEEMAKAILRAQDQ